MSSAAVALKRLREKAKMSVREVAEAIGRPASTYASYEDKFKKPYLPLELVNALLPVFEAKGITSAEVISLAGIVRDSAHAEAAKSTLLDKKFPELTVPEINIQAMPRDVPILGGASCGEDGMFEMNGHALGYALRPDLIKGAKDVYALYVRGESMSRWREHGGLVYVHPHMPVRIHDRVVVQLHPAKGDSTPSAYIKELVRRTAEHVVLLQYKPEQELKIPTKKIMAIHRIMEWDELLGI